MKSNILYFGNFKFPEGNAAGSRVLGNAYVMRDLGHLVTFLDFDENNQTDKITTKTFDGFHCYSLAYPNLIKRIRFLSYLTILEDIIRIERINVVVLYGNPVNSFLHYLLIGFSKKNNIKLIVDIADWHSANSGTYFFRAIKYLDISFRMKYLNLKADGIITVSSYLKTYYTSRGANAIVVPPLVNIKKFEKLSFNHQYDTTKLIYVGQPFPNKNGRKVSKSSYKDRLDVVIESLYKLKDMNFIFNVYGITKNEYLKVIKSHVSVLKDLSNQVIFHGKIENSKVLGLISSSDFSVLFREDTRLSNAGFPTKFVESISCGTPMITTFTSDLEMYISTHELGFGISPHHEEDFTYLLKKALSMDKQDIIKKKLYCFESKAFSHDNFNTDFNNFFNLVL